MGKEHMIMEVNGKGMCPKVKREKSQISLVGMNKNRITDKDHD